MAGEKTIRRIREYADAASGMHAVVLGDAATKIERLIAAAQTAKVALLNRQDKALVEAAERDIQETLHSLDEEL